MSDAKWKLMVDWQGDGEFAGADDDITPATLGLSLRHMRDLKSEYINPARLDIRLANFDHKYSPPNTASPSVRCAQAGTQGVAARRVPVRRVRRYCWHKPR